MSEPQSQPSQPSPQPGPSAQSGPSGSGPVQPTGLTKPSVPGAGAAPEPEPSGGPEPVAEQVPVARPALRLPGRRGVRWVIGIAAVVVLGAVAVGAGAALERHHEREVVAFDRGYAEKRGAVFAPGVPDAPKVPGAPGQLVIRDGDGSVRSLPLGGRVGGIGPDSVNGRGGVAPGWSLAPAALPAVPADQALAKAVAAVPNGKAAALTVVNREGGGSSWSVEVLGADGVRHLVTVDGTDGSVTGNTTTDGR